MEAYAIPLASFIVSLATLVFSAISLRKKANETEVEMLRRRLTEIEIELKTCHACMESLREENITLMKKLVSHKCS